VEALVDILHRVARATVTVSAEIPSEHRSAAVLGTSRSGTGCVVDDSGLVLTVNYVVLGARSVSVLDIEGRRFEGELVALELGSGGGVARGGGGGGGGGGGPAAPPPRPGGPPRPRPRPPPHHPPPPHPAHKNKKTTKKNANNRS
jgi:hypothetical protein